MHNPITNSLRRLLDSHISNVRRQTGDLPCVDADEDLPGWRTAPPVQHRSADGSLLYWQPVDHGNAELLCGLEKGLELKIHPDLAAFYGSFWSDGIDCQSPAGPIHLLQVWNDGDLELLKENLLGHAFMKLKKRQPLTFFIGTGEGENVVVMDNATGEIYFEIPGRRPHRLLARNLCEFLDALTCS